MGAACRRVSGQLLSPISLVNMHTRLFCLYAYRAATVKYSELRISRQVLRYTFGSGSYPPEDLVDVNQMLNLLMILI